MSGNNFSSGSWTKWFIVVIDQIFDTHNVLKMFVSVLNYNT